MNYLKRFSLIILAIVCEVLALLVTGRIVGVLGILGIISAVMFFVLPKTVPEKERKVSEVLNWFLIIFFAILVIIRYGYLK